MFIILISKAIIPNNMDIWTKFLLSILYINQIFFFMNVWWFVFEKLSGHLNIIFIILNEHDTQNCIYLGWWITYFFKIVTTSVPMNFWVFFNGFAHKSRDHSCTFSLMCGLIQVRTIRVTHIAHISGVKSCLSIRSSTNLARLDRRYGNAPIM